MFQDNQVYNYSWNDNTDMSHNFFSKKVEIGLKKKLPLLESELNKLLFLYGRQKEEWEQLHYAEEKVVFYQKPLKFVFYN